MLDPATGRPLIRVSAPVGTTAALPWLPVAGGYAVANGQDVTWYPPV